MDTKYVRIWMRGWAGDEPEPVTTTICDLVLDVADEARVMIACDAVAERFMSQGLASLLSSYDRASFRHRLMDGMMTALGNYTEGMDGDRFHEEIVDEHAYVLAATLIPTDIGDQRRAECDGRFMEHMLMLADHRGVIG